MCSTLAISVWVRSLSSRRFLMLAYTGQLQWKSNSVGWWVEDSAGWYPQNAWQKIDGVWYYFKPDGYMASGEYYNGYWFNGNGSWDSTYKLSWKSNSTGWWVEDISGWWPSSSWLKIDSYWYYFNGSGYMVTSQYIDGYWIGSDGVCR
ncbi:Putative cell wall binding repeat-containing protein [Lachnospiraceae bacterium NE2001]|nr:Putative cell wall binding repeat-containing protein [Lachnospiraceae bacterium NE2001]